MKAPTINPARIPAIDGDVTLFISPEGKGKSWFDMTRRVIFVNGMDNTGLEHKNSAEALSLLQACPVIGVFNKTYGRLADMGQCISDKATLGTGEDDFELEYQALDKTADKRYQLARSATPLLQKVDFIGSLVQRNAATYALYGLLLPNGGVNRRVTPIFCHSQGNLITSNALTAVALALGLDSVAQMEVNSYGSPCKFWPPGLARTEYAFTLDPVYFLFSLLDWSSSKIGFKASHAFKIYMDYDPEFVINRFRTGGLAATVNMDEAGLVKYLVKQGNNAPHIKRIFERLRDAHQTDSDDVAVLYVEALLDPQLKLLKDSDSCFLIALLIELLYSGITFSDEDRAIKRLQKL